MTSYYPPKFSYPKFNPLNFETKVNVENRLITQKTKTSKLSISGNNTVLSSNLIPNHNGNHRIGLSENNTFNLYGNKVLINDGSDDTSITGNNITTNTGVDAMSQSIYFNTDKRGMYMGIAYENGNNDNNGFTMAITGGSGANPKLCFLLQKDGTMYNRGILQNNDIRPNVDNTYQLGSSDFRWNDIYATNGTINTSDERQKKDIENLDPEKTINFVKSLRTVRYKFKNHKRFHCGLIYQELEPLSNEFLKDWGLLYNEDDFLGVRYDELYAILIKTYQYLIEKNELLEKRLNILSK
jgi:hypothetical protein